MDVHRFGDRLHVSHDPDRTPAADLRDRLESLDVTVSEVEPTIEDAFVDLVTGGARAGDATR